MEVDLEDSKKLQKESKDEDNDEHDRSRTPTPDNEFDDEKGSDSLEDPAAAVSEALSKEEPVTVDSRPIRVLKSVLLLQKRKGAKKTLKWKTDLESIRYFELDETERVNVTKSSFTDMKLLDKMNEHEAFQMARKLNGEDVMEEKTMWKPLIPIDTPPALVEPGKDSREKDIQYAREKGILQALYFHRGMIPESAAEPDEERHHIYIDPKIIPLDDLTGNKESEKDYSNVPWPEPKPQPAVSTTSVPSSFFQTFRPNHTINNISPISVPSQINAMPQQMISPMAPEIPNSLPPISSGGGGGGWRTGDGKIVVPDPSITPMPSMNATYPQGMDVVAPMASPNMMSAPMYNQEGYVMAPDEMNYNYNQGPHGPNMYGPGGPPPSGGPPGPPPYQGPRGPPMHGNRGRGGPGWFRGGPPRGMPWRGGWRGNNKQQSICRQFKAGHCRMGDKCHFLHPGQNCPPF
ncbi:serine/threonine-protein phosphatase 1 regulatory subunit 10-like [Copidosoma floridanum]|uniref:serine/threonine-protein phosphatase 1 regulatory subunit 10-like n=1 Tax=Copidosoma floridanum TaxID=29053 RepID=UPI0006C99235|nr:serine/threonine-protein phosphatase 1 regulatory subunit 10-like [Copidosoma floridanum]